MLAKFQYHTNVPLGVCDRDTEIVSSSTKNGGLADSETLNIPYSPCFPTGRHDTANRKARFPDATANSFMTSSAGSNAHN